MAKSYATGITADQLRALLHYDPDTGFFRWREGIDHWRAGLPAGTLYKQRPNGPKRVAIIIGTASEEKYKVIGVRRRVYKAHRLAWLYVYGEWPDGEVDHINGDPADNRIVNLRVATSAENCRNRGLRADNTSGIKGVSWSKRSKRWKPAHSWAIAMEKCITSVCSIPSRKQRRSEKKPLAACRVNSTEANIVSRSRSFFGDSEREPTRPPGSAPRSTHPPTAPRHCVR